MLETIFSRRSIRKYKTDKVDEQDLQTILRAGCYAPTAMNRQPWHFVVVDDRSMLEKLTRVHPYVGMLATAPCAVVVCGDIEASEIQWLADCAAATENILLAAKELGYGTCWCGVAPREERMAPIAELLALPGHIKPYSLIALGVPDEEKTVPERYDEARIHKNRW